MRTHFHNMPAAYSCCPALPAYATFTQQANSAPLHPPRCPTAASVPAPTQPPFLIPPNPCPAAPSTAYPKAPIHPPLHPSCPLPLPLRPSHPSPSLPLPLPPCCAHLRRQRARQLLSHGRVQPVHVIHEDDLGVLARPQLIDEEAAGHRQVVHQAGTQPGSIGLEGVGGVGMVVEGVSGQ